MPLNLSAAHSSRITKRQQPKIPSLRRSVSSPFGNFSQRKPIQRGLSKPETTQKEDEEADDNDEFFEERLEEIGTVKFLTTDASLRDTAQIIQYVRGHMFEAIPEGGGFNSTKIADILNFRQSLPPIVTVTHVHAFSGSPTKTEKEIVELLRAGVIRRVVTPGRGTGGSSVVDGLILFKDIEYLISRATGLDQSNATKFVEHLKANQSASSIPCGLFSSEEATILMRAGFLTCSSHGSQSGGVYAPLASIPSSTKTSIHAISRAASGSVAAVGGDKAIYDAGGRGGIRPGSLQLAQSPGRNSKLEPNKYIDHGRYFHLSLPNTGPLLKLTIAARSHMISLIMKSKFREMPLYLLKEKWDGGVSADDPAARAKRYRGEFAGVLPARTRKWKQFYGLSFDWVIAECLGAGLVELFETGSVGRAIRTT